jgi:predicted Zn finger-like uncharacterized protein
MALATRCPHCQTTFRVAQDQLKLRAGLVRCGACKEIFNGVEHLLPANGPPQTAGAQVPAAVAPPAALDQALTKSPQISGEDPTPTSGASTYHAPETETGVSLPPDMSTAADIAAPVAASVATPAPDPAGTEASPDPLQRMTLMDFSAWNEENEAASESPSAPSGTEPAQPDDPSIYSQTEEPAVDAPDELDRAIEDLQSKPWRRKRWKRSVDDDIEGDEDVAEPDFIRKARRRQGIERTLRIFMIVGSVALLLGALAQAAYAFRNQISVRIPQATPMLVAACARIGCNVAFPAQIDEVSIESSELQTLASNHDTFVLNSLLRNRSAITQAWPNIELTLNDANGNALARRVFEPREYLASASVVNKGFAADSEQQVKVFFELSQLKASGYRVYLFYP